MAGPLVGVVMGSTSDLETMHHCVDQLEAFGVPYEVRVLSAHRTPAELSAWVATAQERGVEVFVAAAGMAAALPGVVASQTSRPVLGVPMESKLLGGLDSLLSMVQMPGGVPVGTLAIGRAGAVNAAILATQILALAHAEYRRPSPSTAAQAAKVLADAERLGGLRRGVAHLPWCRTPSRSPTRRTGTGASGAAAT
jgi:5-(carboxyamino)imidazole ribonucleotide mutase